MDLGKLRTGEWIAGVGSVGLLITLFLPWFGDASDATAWQAFGVVDVLLVVVAALGLGLAIATATRHAPAIPVALLSITVAGAIVGLIAILVRLLDQPGPDTAVDTRLGVYLGLVAVLTIFAGAWWAMADERPETETRPLVPAQPAPPATAPEGSVVARGVAPAAAPLRDS